MSAADIAAAKAAVESYQAGKDMVLASELVTHVREATGLDFSGPTLVRYLKAHGFGQAGTVNRAGVGKVTTYYTRERN